MGTKKNDKPAGGNEKPAKAENDSKPQPWWFNQPNPIDRFTGWLGIWTAVLSIATIALGVVAYFQWRELHKTDETLQKTLFVSQRPWIAVETTIDGPFSLKYDHVSVPLRITMRNVGNSPAINVSTYPVMSNVKSKYMKVTEIPFELCYSDDTPYGGLETFFRAKLRSDELKREPDLILTVLVSQSLSSLGFQLLPFAQTISVRLI